MKEQIPESDQWKPGMPGNCEICRRRNYCNAMCRNVKEALFVKVKQAMLQKTETTQTV